MHEQTRRNLEYYGRLTAGQAGYWRYMPAPRSRRRVVLRTLAAANPTSVLDLGCGDGSLLTEIRSALPRARLAGIDLSAPQIEQNRRAMPEIDWYCLNAESDHAVARAFDAVTASEVIEHVADPEAFLRNARAMAARHGILILTTQSGRIGATERHVGHRRHFTRAEITELLRETGWTPVRVWNSGFPFHDLSKWAANLSPHRMIDQFGERPYGRFQRLVCVALRLLFLVNSNRRGAQLFAIARRTDA